MKTTKEIIVCDICGEEYLHKCEFCGKDLCYKHSVDINSGDFTYGFGSREIEHHIYQKCSERKLGF